MSVLINMEMQRRCIDCPFMVSRDNDDCILQSDLANEIARTWNDLKANCPLVEVPPHGRLIDADALNSAIENDFDGVCVYDVSPSEAVNDMQGIVDRQPTIIEAEGSGS